jgi:hypothetical protein
MKFFPSLPPHEPFHQMPKFYLESDRPQKIQITASFAISSKISSKNEILRMMKTMGDLIQTLHRIHATNINTGTINVGPTSPLGSTQVR